MAKKTHQLNTQILSSLHSLSPYTWPCFDTIVIIAYRPFCMGLFFLYLMHYHSSFPMFPSSSLAFSTTTGDSL